MAHSRLPPDGPIWKTYLDRSELVSWLTLGDHQMDLYGNFYMQGYYNHSQKCLFNYLQEFCGDWVTLLYLDWPPPRFCGRVPLVHHVQLGYFFAKTSLHVVSLVTKVAAWWLPRDLASSRHYMYMREYWVQAISIAMIASTFFLVLQTR